MAELTYSPTGATGFSAELHASGGARLVVERHSADHAILVDGDPALVGNATIVGAVEAYAIHELGARRTRSADIEDANRTRADDAEKTATQLADLLEHLTGDQTPGFCSSCLGWTDHERADLKRARDAYICGGCGAATIPCITPGCDHFAIRSTGKVGVLRYCAEHRHAIPGFEKLDAHLAELTDYEAWLEFEQRNMKRLTVTVMGAAGGALIVGPLALAAAPALGGALGASTGLTGAAATSHGLALLGGGAVSAGGLGMAGGTAVVTAVGSGLGGRMGASVTTAYVGADKSFAIEKIADGTGKPIVFASGFLTEDRGGWGGWERVIRERYPDNPVYRVRWGAKELKDLAALGMTGAAGTTVRGRALELGLRATTAAGKQLGALGGAFTAFGIAKNPWSVARTRAEMTGAVLADLIARTDQPSFVLAGHSLGARLMFEAVTVLATRDAAPKIEEVHLLGAAVDADADLHGLHRAVAGKVYNYWSSSDGVLGIAYRAGQFGTRAAGGSGFSKRSPVVKNENVSRAVDNHSAYIEAVSLVSRGNLQLPAS